MELAAVVDDLLDGVAVVFGSLPPAGRDLDLVVRPNEERALAGGLLEAGLIRDGRSWIRFGPCPPQVIDLVSVDDWELSEGEAAAVFEEAVPLDGRRFLSRPAPHHLLLILARRAVRDASDFAARKEGRIREALGDAPDAFTEARRRAGGWHAARSIDALERSFREGSPLGVARRAGAVAAEIHGRGGGGLAVGQGTFRALLPRPRLGAVVALSGLDGSGKSSQARLLRDALEQLGFDATVEWPAIDAPSRSLGVLARGGKSLLGRSQRTVASSTEAGPAATVQAGKHARQGSRLLTRGWACLMALRGGGRVARKTWPHLIRGRLVICDRYVLDSWIYLLHEYGEGSGYGVELAIMRLLCPRPCAAYLLAVAPETASRRQPERIVAVNARRARLYERLAPRLGVQAVDGERSPEEICGDLAQGVWRTLRRSR